MATTRLEPTSAQEAAFMLFDAGLHGRRIVPRGGATKLAAAAIDPSSDAWMSTLGLSGSIAHDPGDLVATVPAGMSLREVNWQLGQSGQWLPLDPPHAERATIGGIVATNDSGPRRHRYGAPRDLILGVELAMTDGRVVHAGGRVVKNVAGYDLSRLVCGSEGRLGLITTVTFKLAPLTPASRSLVFEAHDLAALGAAAMAVAMAPATPSAIEIASHPERVLVRFDSTASAVDRMADATTALVKGLGVSVTSLDAASGLAGWDAHERAVHGGDDTILKLALLPSLGVEALTALQGKARHLGIAWSFWGRLALGVFELRLQGEPDAVRSMIEAAITVAGAGHGHAVVKRGSADLRRVTARAGDDRLQALERAVVQQFDPRGVLSADRHAEPGTRI